MKKYTTWMILAIFFILATATFVTLYIMERKKMAGKNVSTDNNLDVVTDALGRKFPKAGSVTYVGKDGKTYSSNL